MKIDNVEVYGMGNSFRVSKFPKAVNVNACTEELTNTIRKLGAAQGGTGHDNFLKGIIVQFDLTCTIKMWTEAERYHFFEIVSSQSTMHKIAEMDLDYCCSGYVSAETIKTVKELQKVYQTTKEPEHYLRLLYNVPVGLELTAGISTNYSQLKTIYRQRQDHRLPEWREFCKWIEALPAMDIFLGTKKEQ